MDKEIKKIYKAFGYDISKGLRKLNQITDKEAINLAKIFDHKLDWEVSCRNNETIDLKSSPIPLIVYRSYGRGSYTKETTKDIRIHSSGKVGGPMFAENEKYILVNQYLISIGVEQPVLTKGKLETILNE